MSDELRVIEVRYQPGVDYNDNEPFIRGEVELSDGRVLSAGTVSVSEAREHAIGMAVSATYAECDAALIRFLKAELNANDALIANALLGVRQAREQEAS